MTAIFAKSFSVLVLTGLVCNAAAGLACALAGSLALAAAALDSTLSHITGIQSHDMFRSLCFLCF